jgi:FkbM family methyltransferase
MISKNPILLEMRRIFRKMLRNAGFQRRIAPDTYDIIVDTSINTVLDVGANDGDFGRDIRDRGYKGRIISFEPNPVAFHRLKNAIANDPLWSAYQLALGEEDDETLLSIAENDTMSSIKQLTSFGESTGAKVIDQVTIKIARLETFLQENQVLEKNIFLKIDTQGFEMEVRRGTGHSLNCIKAIQAEISLVHTYADELDWLEILKWMRDRKFEVATAICNSSIGAQVREFDFIFVNPE